MITEALNTIFVELFSPLTLGDQIDRQSSSLEKKMSDGWNVARSSLSSTARVHSDITKLEINGM